MSDLAARVSKLEDSVRGVQDTLNRVGVDVAELKGRTQAMPTSWEVTRQFQVTTLSIIAVVITVVAGGIGFTVNRIDRSEAALNARMEKSEAALSARMEKSEAALSARMEKSEATLSARMDRSEAALNSRMDRLEAKLDAALVRLLPPAKH